VGLFDFETKIRKMMFDMIDPWMKRQVADQQTVAKIRGDLEKANRKAEDQDFLLQKIEAKLVAFDDIYKKLASFVGPRPIADNFL
jgi:glycerol-3-phosphate dehydrogenase